MHRTLFCANPKVHGLICEAGGTAVGFAVYFFNYSTWQGRHGLYLEDLYVSPEHRGKGAGMVYMAGKPDHKMDNERMVDHIVELVEAKAAELAKAAAPLEAAE